MPDAWIAASSLAVVSPLLLTGIALLAASRDPGASRVFFLGGPASSGRETWTRASRLAGLWLAASAVTGVVVGLAGGDPLWGAVASYTMALAGIAFVAVRSAAWLERELFRAPPGGVEPLRAPSTAHRAAATAGALLSVLGLVLAARSLGEVAASLIPAVTATLLIAAGLVFAPPLIYRPWLGERRSYALASAASLLCGLACLLAGVLAYTG